MSFGAIGYGIYRYHQRKITENKQSVLTTIAKLTKEQLNEINIHFKQEEELLKYFNYLYKNYHNNKRKERFNFL